MSTIQNLDKERLDLNLLLVFEAMVDLHSVTAVSERLEISQPNVSYALKKLRSFFGDELFIRSARGMQPTSRALELREPVQRMLQILRDQVLSAGEFVPEESRRTFVINMTELGEFTFLPPLLKRCAELAPGVRIDLVCLGLQDLVDAMREGRVDLALGYLPDLNARTVYAQTLMRHPFICLARKGHPLTHEGLTVDAYTLAEHVGLIGEGHGQRRFEESIEKSGLQRRVRLRSRNYMSIPFIVRESDLIATVPKIMAVVCAELSGLQAFQPPFAIDPIPITQYWSERQKSDSGQMWLRRSIAELFLDKDPTAHISVC